MEGHRERKKQRTRASIHEAAMRLFAERGYADTTIADIAAAAGVSRATFFNYFPAKEDVVFGEAPEALAALGALLAEPRNGVPVLVAVRQWLSALPGWLDDEDLPLQLRIAAEVPSVGARRVQLQRDAEDLVAAALARDLSVPDREIVARMAAAAILGAIATVERSVADLTRARRRRATAEEIEAVLDAAMSFVGAGLEALGR